MVGGLIVGMTSVGSGSLMIVMLLFLYPMLGANQLVGTDLTQAVPLTVAAALGALAFGHVEFSVTTSIIIGSVPAVIVGSFISSRAPDKYIRPAITFVIFASGLKYVGLGTTALGWVLCATLLAVATIWLFYVRPWQSGAPLGAVAAAGDEQDESVRADSPHKGLCSLCRLDCRCPHARAQPERASLLPGRPLVDRRGHEGNGAPDSLAVRHGLQTARHVLEGEHTAHHRPHAAGKDEFGGKSNTCYETPSACDGKL